MPFLQFHYDLLGGKLSLEQEALLTQPVSGLFSARVRTKSGPCGRQMETSSPRWRFLPSASHSSTGITSQQEGSVGPGTYSTWIQELFYLSILSVVLLFQTPKLCSHQIHIAFLHM